jgi:DNA mismatch endonuclease (patch repair protein)
LEGNVTRDRDTDIKLRDGGWRVPRFWEHEDSATAARRILEAMESQRRVRWNATP